MNNSTNPTQPKNADESELGKKTAYDQAYNPDRLFPIPCAGKRNEIGIDVKAPLPFHGFDCWNHYEVSWLNEKGKPVVAIAEIIYDCESPNIIESKSLKLYFNSFNNAKFKDVETVQNTIQKDLSKAIQAEVKVNIAELNRATQINIGKHPTGECLDDLDITCTQYLVDTSTLTTENTIAEEILYSDLLKSNCLVTNQPDWGTVQIHYQGPKINHEGLLKYIVSFRNHNEFHEQCIERIFMDILRHCKPKILTVSGRYTRRGGLDINPYRSTEKGGSAGLNQRLIRQ